MTIRRLVIVCSLLVVSIASPLAQSRGGATDPLSGNWSGVFRISGRDIPIGLELKHDGKGVVSGKLSGMQNPGEVKTGSFDIKTGTLKLRLGKVDDEAVLIVLEGTVTGNAATGAIDTESGAGTFQIKKGSV